MNFSNLFATEIAADQILLIVLLVIMVAVVIVLPMFTQKKRQKQVTKLQDSVSVGCTVETVGGIIGEVVALRDGVACREMVIETGTEPNKSTMVFDMQALYRVLSPLDGETPAETQEPFAAPTTEEKPDAYAPAEEVKAAEEPATAEPVSESAQEPVAESEPASEETAATVEEEPKEKAAKAAVTPSANSSKTKRTTKKK